MKYRVVHTTEYKYENEVSFCHNRAILTPRELYNQKNIYSIIDITPTPSNMDTFLDFYGNEVTHFLIQKPHDFLKVTSTFEVEKTQNNFISQDILNITLRNFFNIMKDSSIESDIFAKDFIFDTQLTRCNSHIRRYAMRSFKKDRSIYEATVELMSRIYYDFKFVPGSTNVFTKIDEIYTKKEGVCQDFAHFAISCLRSVGLPARYISGYIETLPPEGEEKLVGSDASHAWFSLYIPNFGWFDFDPTNNTIPNEQHIVVSFGRDYNDITPLKGVVFSSGNNLMSVGVDVRRV